MSRVDIKATVTRQLARYGIGAEAIAWSPRQTGVLEVLIGGELRRLTAKHGMPRQLIDSQIDRLEGWARQHAERQQERSAT